MRWLVPPPPARHGDGVGSEPEREPLTSPFAYQRPLHRARTTDDYVFAQLIPYIGNKRKLLPLLHQGLLRCGATGPGVRLVDAFSGSTVVARMARSLGMTVLANDWEPYAHELARATIAARRAPDFRSLGGRAEVYRTLNDIEPREDWVTRHLCPRSDEHPDPDRERMFFTRANGSKIDAIRCQIEAWESAGTIDRAERADLLAALLYAASYVSNTSGLWKAFHRGWGGATRTALYRIMSPIELRPPPLLPSPAPGFATQLDVVDGIERAASILGAPPDIVYLDPPYNQHPYGSNYHVLNTLTLWDRPALSRSTVVDGKTRDKAAIRRDWSERRSPFNHRDTAGPALERAVDACPRRSQVLLSYSTDGMLGRDQVEAILAARGDVEFLTAPYKRYRVSSQRPSPRPRTVEYLAILRRR